MRTSHLLKLDNSQPPISYGPLHRKSDGRIRERERERERERTGWSLVARQFSFLQNYKLSEKLLRNKSYRTDWHISIWFFMIVWPCIATVPLWIKPTDALKSSFFGITTLHVAGSISAHHQEFLAVHGFWYILCSFDDRLLPSYSWQQTVITTA